MLHLSWLIFRGIPYKVKVFTTRQASANIVTAAENAYMLNIFLDNFDRRNQKERPE